MRYEAFTDFRSMSGHDSKSGEIDLDLAKRHRISIKRPPTMPRALNLVSGAAELLKGYRETQRQAQPWLLSFENAQESRLESGAKKAPSPTPTRPSNTVDAAVPLQPRAKSNATSSRVNPYAQRKSTLPPALSASASSSKVASGSAPTKPGPSKNLDESKVLKGRPTQLPKPCSVESVHSLSTSVAETNKLLTTSRSVKGKERASESPPADSLPSKIQSKKKGNDVVDVESEGVNMQSRRERMFSMTGNNASSTTVVIESSRKPRGLTPSSSSSTSSGSASPPPVFPSSRYKSSVSDDERPQKKMRWDMPPPPLPAKCQPPQGDSDSSYSQPSSSESPSPPSGTRSLSPVIQERKEVRKRVPPRRRAHSVAVPLEQLEPVVGQKRKYDDTIAKCPHKCSLGDRLLACNRCKVFMIADRLTGVMNTTIAEWKVMFPDESSCKLN